MPRWAGPVGLRVARQAVAIYGRALVHQSSGGCGGWCYKVRVVILILK